MADEYNARIETAVTESEQAKDSVFGILTADENTDVPIPGCVDRIVLRLGPRTLLGHYAHLHTPACAHQIASGAGVTWSAVVLSLFSEGSNPSLRRCLVRRGAILGEHSPK